MSSDREELARAIRDAGGRHGLSIIGEAERRLVAYALELEKWNKRINLIRYRERADLVARHLADGIAASRRVPEGAGSLVEVGAGAGIPGAVIAALRVELEVVALEPIHKKHAFLRTIRRSVPLRNYTPYAARLGDEDEPEGLEGRFDVAISRATWSVGEWLARGRRLVRPGGLVLAMEGREQAELPAGAIRHPYDAGDRQRAIVVYQLPAD